MKKLIALLLLACTVLCLCACGTTENDETKPRETDPQVTETQTTEPQETKAELPEGMAEYVAYIKDEGGNPVTNVMVQICLEQCLPNPADENGKVTWIFDDAEGCKVSFPFGLPEGYTYVDEAVTEFYFEAGSKEITITLKAIG